ncbi:YciI family protein [Actinomadura macra]|uniref:YciI family protein n=1 Tax=Actinomadura macra TaxID=46164 RepID=UPI0008377A1F|nr:YciI family protein [Actinomadura macra]
MTKYMLSAHSAEGQSPPPMSPEDIQHVTEQVLALEGEMKEAGVWVFGGRLHSPDTATVVRASGQQVITTDGPFVEAREHLGGFYVLEAADLDTALSWAAKVTSIVGAPIEVRPFAGQPEG